MSENTKSVKITKVSGKQKFMDILWIPPKPLKEDEVRDTLDEGKIMFGYMEYDNSNKKVAGRDFQHYMDADTARVVLGDILNMKFVKDPNASDRYLPLVYEFKGTSGKMVGHEEWEVASRQLSVDFAQMNKGACINFTFLLSEGVRQESGAIMPKKGGPAPLKGTMVVALPEARRVAASVLAFLQAKLTLTLGE